MLPFYNPRPQVHLQNLRCWLCAQQLKKAKEDYQRYNTKRQPRPAILIFNDWVILDVLSYFLTSLILSHREIPVEYRLMTCLLQAFPFFSPFSFSSRCLHSVYVLLIISSLALSTLPCVHFCPKKCALPLCMTPFNSYRFLCFSVPSFGVSTTSPKNSLLFNIIKSPPYEEQY